MGRGRDLQRLRPFIATALIKTTGNPLAPAFYVMFAGVLSFIATLFVREGAGRPLPGESAEVRGGLREKPA